MSESDWLSSESWSAIRASFAQTTKAHPTAFSQRKSRLFTVGCYRDAAERLPIGGIEAFSVVEDHADGVADREITTVLRRRLDQLSMGSLLSVIDLALDDSRSAADLLSTCARRFSERSGVPPRTGAFVGMEVFGNPFRPVSFDASWRTSTVVSLAKAMYDSRDFGPMPLLADALQDAGCGHADILDHCRGAGPHVKGCWVVDLVRGRG